MHLTRLNKLRLGIGLAAVFALALVVVAIGMNSEARTVTADGETPTKIANNGSLGGVVDILVHDGTEAVGLYYCIGKTDHQVNGTETDTTPDVIKTSIQCNIDLVTDPTFDGDTPPGWCALANACNATGGGPDFVPGPPPPPPYSIFPPVKGYGFYYHDGADPYGECSGVPCTVTTTCFEAGGPQDVGPNFISRAVAFNPLTANPSTGRVDLWYNQSIASCKLLTPKGTTAFNDLTLNTWLVYDKGLNLTGQAAPWRPTNTDCSTPGVPCVLNFDGDACNDLEELSKTSIEKCGDDPQNPNDSFFDIDTVDLSGTWSIGVRLARADCTDSQNCTGSAVPGAYIVCITDLQHNPETNAITFRPYCYNDIAGIEINPEAYPGATGDGFSGGVPPGQLGGPSVYPSGFPSWAYGDVDNKHTELTGFLNKTTNNIEVEGCFTDPDGGGLGTVWISTAISAHMNPGSFTLYINQPDNCEGSPIGTGQEVLAVAVASFKGTASDADNDGVPSSRELGDDATCGRRDPFNGNDYYDISVPRDGVIDLANDILGVIKHYSPAPYPAGATDVFVDHDGGTPGHPVINGTPQIHTTQDNYDRSQKMGIATDPTPPSQSPGTWNRGAPDRVIDLPNDILGVIQQYNPAGCSLILLPTPSS